MKYDYLFIDGIQKKEGNLYICTPQIQVLDSKIEVIFDKIYREPTRFPELTYLTEIKLSKYKANNLLKQIQSLQNKNDTSKMYAVFKENKLSIYKAINGEYGLYLMNKDVGIVNENLILETSSEANKTISYYRQLLNENI